MNGKPMPRRQKLEMERQQLMTEASSFTSHYRDLCDYIEPRRGRFFLQDVNRGDRRNQKIINSTATTASRTLSSGLMSGVTSPARPWFHLTTPDPDLAQIDEVKQWLHIVEERMSSIFLASNLYQKLPTVYKDVGTFSTAAMSIEKDFTDVIRCSVFPVGSYRIACDFKGRVNTFQRDFQMSVQQIVEQFGMKNPDTNEIVDWTNISTTVKDAYENNRFHTMIDVCHIIRPNERFNPSNGRVQFKRFEDLMYERSASPMDAGAEVYLRETGHDIFPILAPRWEVAGEDSYGTNCPGMTCLGDVRALQTMERRAAQAIEKKINPPMVGPTSMINSKSSILPGDITYVDEQGNSAFRAAHEVNLDLGDLDRLIEKTEMRINRGFFTDLFLMLDQRENQSPLTATEVDERGQEKLLAIGPVLEQFNQDLLNPLINTTFQYALELGKFPPIPEALHGVPLRVEYISVMQQAQKLISLDGVNKFNSFMQNLISYDPRALYKFNTNEAINVYADLTSIPPKMIVSDDDANAAMAQAQQAQQAQQQAQTMNQSADTAQKLSQTKTGGDNALSKLLGV